MAEDYKGRLQKLLLKLFQFDTADLDFGIYRIMNHKRGEIERFINKDLIEAVDSQFEELSDAGQDEIVKKIGAIKKDIIANFGEDAIDSSGEIIDKYKDTSKAKEYYKRKAELASVEVSDQQKAEIFSHIYQFFSRYYDEGDFLSLRRYSKDNKYAIPYNGEEVLLHWANSDQYYIKTGEYFQNYSFKAGDYKVNFRISQAEVDKNNIKSDKRFFFLKGEDNFVIDDEKKEFTVFFEYRGPTAEEEKTFKGGNVQQNILNSMKDEILSGATDASVKRGLEKTKDKKTILEKHLFTYAKKNTTDYFIHKDLKGFFERELDFYIKNEVLNLDDLGSEKEPSIEKYMTRVRVIKEISRKIIEFLAHIEDFQKKLWEKKKFVVGTDYCMTLDYIDEKNYPEILKNEKQIEEWKKLYAFDINKEVNRFKEKLTGQGKSDGEIKIELLRKHPTMVIDTRFYGQDFRYQILSEIDDLDMKITGILINSENYQALNLLRKKYEKKIKCCYIDPPYNSKSTEIVYKNNYKHSSWLALLENRITLTKGFLKDEDGILIVAIDENEQERLGLLLGGLFPDSELTCVTVIHNPGGIQGQNFSYCHEYAYFVYPKGGRFIGLQERDENADIRPLRDVSKGEHLREAAANCFYPILVKDKKIIGFGDVCDDSFHPSSANVLRDDGIIEVYPIDAQGNERKWVFARQSVETIKDELTVEYNKKRKIQDIIRTKTRFNYKTVWDDKKYNANIYGSKLLNNILGEEELFSFPKSIYNVHDCVSAATHNSENGLVIDYFSGSGTTGHAVLKLNKKDKSKRKFILVEMGQYFDTVLKPRVLKVIYSDNWKNGKPQDNNGSRKQIIKYHKLEQYEDALNNIEFMDKGAVQKTLDTMDDYFLSYMLDFETRDSQTLLNVDQLSRPFEYKLKIVNSDSEITEEMVDLVETFNYLIGLHVMKIRVFEFNGNYYRSVYGRKGEEKIAVVWRNTDDIDLKADKKFIEGTVLKDLDYDVVYVNGDCYVEKARPIEREFKVLMGG